MIGLDGVEMRGYFVEDCGKFRFPDKLEALIQFVNLRLVVGEREQSTHHHRVEQGCYECRHCEGYHFTSWPTWKKGRIW